MVGAADHDEFVLSRRWRAVLRAFSRRGLRNSELALIFLSAALGFLVGSGVSAIREAMQWLHELNFSMPAERLLSEGIDLSPWRVVLMPIVGGVLAGVATMLIRRWRPRETVDAIEANALYGGKMSLIDSVNLGFQTMIAGGFGASVGLEAAYTQLGSGVTSNIGELLHIRRADLRTLVGCGAAAAIAAAFNAPLAGAFYAFELVIGDYTAAVLAPVAVAALTGTFAARWIFGSTPLFFMAQSVAIRGWDYPLFALLGLGAAGLGIASMVAVTTVERGLRRRWLPPWIRPALGGAAVGGIAYFYAPVLGSGHGAIQHVLSHDWPLLLLLTLVPAKALASAVSVGAGFRGGLFSSALFLGSLYGGSAGGLLLLYFPDWGLDPIAYALVGMGSVAAAIIGAPVTMILLTLELTADFYVAMGVMVGVVIASAVVRITFGYSFATWRFHLRGVPIRGATDVGWLRALSVERLMRRDVPVAAAATPLAEMRRRFPLGGAKFVFLTDERSRYAGMCNAADIHNPDLKSDGKTARDLGKGERQYLLPHEDVRAALTRFAGAEMDALAVLDGVKDARIIGFLTEAYALRRYNQGLEQTRLGELGIGTPPAVP